MHKLFIKSAWLFVISAYDIVLLQGNKESKYEVSCILDSSWEKNIPVDICQEGNVAALEALKGGGNPHSPFISGSLCFEVIGEAVWAA